MKTLNALVLMSTGIAAIASARSTLADTLPESVRPYVTVSEPRFALRHVRVIDGTGAPPLEDQVVLVADGRISAVGPVSLDEDSRRHEDHRSRGPHGDPRPGDDARASRLPD